MYAIALLRYRRPLDQVLLAIDRHRAWLRELKQRGLLIASGPFDPRYGGALLLRVPDGEAGLAALAEIRDGDPFWQESLAQYELLPWDPNIGREDLDLL